MESSEGIVTQTSGLRGGVNAIAHPLANEKLSGRALKLVRKGAKNKSIRRGVKEIVKAIRKKETGILVLAGNVSPIDVISHLPVLAEENDIPYIYVPAKEELGMLFITCYVVIMCVGSQCAQSILSLD